MATWLDYLSLLATLAIFAGIVYAYLFAKNALPGAFESAKDSLKTRGVDISGSGLSVKTDKRFDREQYLDATQRGFIKAFQASSAGAPGQAMERRGSQPGKRKVGRQPEAVDK